MRQDCVSKSSRVLNVDRLAPLSKLTPNMLSQLLCFIEDDNSSHLIITLPSGFDPYKSVFSGCSSGKIIWSFKYVYLKKKPVSGVMCVWRSEDRLESQFSPFMFTWVLGIRLRASGLYSKNFYPLEPSCQPWTRLQIRVLPGSKSFSDFLILEIKFRHNFTVFYIHWLCQCRFQIRAMLSNLKFSHMTRDLC